MPKTFENVKIRNKTKNQAVIPLGSFPHDTTVVTTSIRTVPQGDKVVDNPG